MKAKSPKRAKAKSKRDLPRVTKKLKDLADRLQILEMQKGWHYMLGSQLNQEYEEWLKHYENITGKPFEYRNA